MSVRPARRLWQQRRVMAESLGLAPTATLDELAECWRAEGAYRLLMVLRRDDTRVVADTEAQYDPSLINRLKLARDYLNGELPCHCHKGD